MDEHEVALELVVAILESDGMEEWARTIDDPVSWAADAYLSLARALHAETSGAGAEAGSDGGASLTGGRPVPGINEIQGQQPLEAPGNDF